jgi:glutamate formiminotransferase
MYTMKNEIKNIQTALEAGSPEVDVVDMANNFLSNRKNITVLAKKSKVLNATNITRSYATGSKPVQNAWIAKSTGNAVLTMDVQDNDNNGNDITRTVPLTQIKSLA